MKKLGLLGKSLGHSRSPELFQSFFSAEGLSDWEYPLYEKPNLDGIRAWALEQGLIGFNVTIPYKMEILEHCDVLSEAVAAIGAANTIKICTNYTSPLFEAHNTDVHGFEALLKPYLSLLASSKALILGTGGAAKAVAYVLHRKQIPFAFVSRSPELHTGAIPYSAVNKDLLASHLLVIQTTPLGMHPHYTTKPDIPYSALGSHHVCIDLVYNPASTAFMDACRHSGATVENGYKMLEEQAKKAWHIFNSPC